jgi:hypothetical protein
MQRYHKLFITAIFTATFAGGHAVAQVAPVPAAAPNLINANASDTRGQLSELMNQYPPTLLRVLQTDPALLQNKDYLSPYPALAAFVSKHPEILHNATYFLGSPREFGGPVYGNDAREITREVATDLSISTVLITIVFAITWILRSVIEHRRWAQLHKTQTEVHSRVMDRLTSSEDLLAYIQSPAGKRFLEFAPVDIGAGTAGPMLSRILWSVQAGLVLGLAGVGLSYASRHIPYQVSQPFFVLGMLGMAVGAGFILSAFASYIIARNMGLVHGTSETPPT